MYYFVVNKCMYVCFVFVSPPWFETRAAVPRVNDFVGAMLAWPPAPGGAPASGGSGVPASGGSGMPASGGGIGPAPGGRIGPAPGGRIGPAPDGRTVVSGRPMWKCRQMKPFATAKMHCWSFTKGEAGARVEMKRGDWNKEQLEHEVQFHDGHDDIIEYTAMQNKLLRHKFLPAFGFGRQFLCHHRLLPIQGCRWPDPRMGHVRCWMQVEGPQAARGGSHAQLHGLLHG